MTSLPLTMASRVAPLCIWCLPSVEDCKVGTEELVV
eukprot:CAMPEP_0184308436 /NCGR_PEP_ID=MMETSP1049-20130417/16891_1 /TAXON_ID=77928 /ORGANISM="Proteomonas sulcata, Strain CCMP704" /LENGTH=35 /DNA_ID= /DNA_START= /DNA_END= /DNA_ORIENTATION=